MSDHDVKDRSLDKDGKKIEHHDEPGWTPEAEAKEAPTLTQRVEQLEEQMRFLLGLSHNRL